MKKLLASCVAVTFTAALSSASPSDDLAAAAKKISEAANYSWTTTTEIANSQFPAMPVHGVTEKGGYTVITREFNGNSMQTVRKGELTVTQNREGDWMTQEEMRAQFQGGGGQRGGGAPGGAGGSGRGRGGFGFGGGFGMGAGNPAENAANLAGKLKNLKAEGDALVATVSGEEATALLASLGGGRGGRGGDRSGGGQGPAGPRWSSISVKFWLKDGALVKFEMHSVGKFSTPDGEEREFNSTSTTEFKDVGTTKIVVPEAAKKKLGA